MNRGKGYYMLKTHIQGTNLKTIEREKQNFTYLVVIKLFNKKRQNIFDEKSCFVVFLFFKAVPRSHAGITLTTKVVLSMPYRNLVFGL